MTKLDHAWAMEQLRRYQAAGTLHKVLAWVEEQIPVVDTAYRLMRELHNDPYRRGWSDIEVRRYWRTFGKLKTIRRRLYFLKTRLARIINS